jgi:hypothetical protein
MRPRFVHPAMDKLPGITAMIGASLQRIYFGPRPHRTDVRRSGEDTVELSRAEGDRILRFIFSGADGTLSSVEAASAEAWRTSYFDYRQVGRARIPTRILLEDATAGYRLEIWQEEVLSGDE